MAGLFVELRRRNVFKVGVAYLIVAWLLLQVAATAFPALHLPDWTVTFVTALLMLGLPIALILAWAFELTPQGIKRSAEVPLQSSITRMTGRKLGFAIIGLLAIAVIGLTADKYLVLDTQSVHTDTAAVTEATLSSETSGSSKSVAVLPFVNMSADSEQEFFAEGISEEILTTLSAIRELKVAGRTSSFQFKGTNKDLREIGRTLGVANLLEGSVRKSGNKVRITAQLIEAENGFHLWSKTFDREYADIFTIQEEIAEAVGNALQVELGIAVQQSVVRRTAEDLEAYSLYLQAMQYNRIGDLASLRKSLELSKRIMDMDPDFLPGYVAYGAAAMMLNSWGIDTSGKSLEKLEQLLQVAVSRDPTYAEAWATLGAVHVYRYQWKQAEESYATAIKLSPNSPMASGGWSYALLSFLGRPAEAIDPIARVIDVEPLALNNRSVYAEALATVGRLDDAEAAFQQLLELNPDYSNTYFRIAEHYYTRMGRPGAAVPWYRKADGMDPENPWILAELAQALYDLGAVKDAQAVGTLLENLGEGSDVVSAFRYNLARLNGEEKAAAEFREYLAANLDRMVEGLHYVETLEWLRSLQAEDPERALRVYRRIQPRLFDDPPEVGPWNHGLAVGLALLERQMGHQATAEKLARAVLEVVATTTEFYGYYTAPVVAQLVLGDEDAAMAALEQSFRQDGSRYIWSMLEIDPVFDPLRSRPEFQALLDYIRSDMAAQLEKLRVWETSENHTLVLDFTESQ